MRIKSVKRIACFGFFSAMALGVFCGGKKDSESHALNSSPGSDDSGAQTETACPLPDDIPIPSYGEGGGAGIRILVENLDEPKETLSMAEKE